MVTVFQQANQLLREGKLKEAIANYQKAIKKNPNFYYYHYNLGQTLEKLGNWQEAIQSYKKALKIQPKSIWSLTSLSRVLEKVGQLEESQNLKEKARIIDKKLFSLLDIQLPEDDINFLQVSIKTASINQPVINKLTKPRLPQWFLGKASFKQSSLTILLCAHVAGRQIFGSERSFLELLTAFSQLNLNIVVTLPSAENKEYVNLCAEYSLGVYVFPYQQWINNRNNDPLVLLNFGDIIATHNISIVYANTIVLVEPLTMSLRMRRISVIHARELITYDNHLREKINLPAQAIIQKCFERSDFIIANSHETEKIFARESRTYYVPNTVDPNYFEMENKIGTKVRVGIVSSNIPKKGISDFLQVAKMCQDIANLVDFVVIGPNNHHINNWKRDILAEVPAKNVHFLGYRATPQEAMAEINILLNLSSFAESFGRTIAEAMAMRRPVIAYEWGALPELVQHGETGFLAPFRDIQTVAIYVRQLCHNRLLIRQMGEAGLTHIKNHFSQEVIHQYLKNTIEDIKKTSSWSKLNITTITNQPKIQVTIVIPVYNATDEVRNCIDSIIKNTPLDQINLLVINDGSTDVQIEKLLREYGSLQGIKILSNLKNIGYTKTINRGIKECGQTDVVLLNSDTIVTPNWLSGLKSTAYGEAKIGTVTAMSDNAGAFSFPVPGISNPKPPKLSYDDYAMQVINTTINCDFVDVPTGSGFCMYIRRELINAIGLFDDVLFPRGYGEENDFCLRALEAGWRNVISPWAFVYHIRNASFKEEREKLMRQGVAVISQKYPEYNKLVKEGFSSEKMQILRLYVSNVLKY